MELEDIFQVAKTSSDNIANNFLTHGWKLLYVTSTASTDDRYLNYGAYQNSEPCFVLGATKEISEKYPRSKGFERLYG